MITITGITNSSIPGKSLVYFDITVGASPYQWQTLVPELSGQTLQEYLDSKTAFFESDINAKEAIWAVCPKTKEVEQPDGTTITVNVSKDEIVFPTLQAPTDIFNSTIFLGRVIQILDPMRWIALSKLGVGWTMQQLIDYPDNDKAACFSRLKGYLGAIQADGTLTPDEVVNIYGLVLEQGVDLSLSSI